MLNSANITKYLSWPLLALVLVGCKPEKPLQPVPLTQALSGKEKAPCEGLVFGGFPRSVENLPSPVPSKKTNQPNVPAPTSFVCRDTYVLNYDTQRNISLWVSERLTATQLSQTPVVNQSLDESRPDPALPPSKRADHQDYIGIGYGKGFFASPQNYLSNDIGYSHSYYVSNMFPEHPSHAMVWKELESWVRDKAIQQEELIVFSGPVYLNGTGKGWVGKGSVRNPSAKSAHKGKIQVPTHTFKVVVNPQTKQTISFVVPNDVLHSSSLASFVVPLSMVEKSTGLAFFPDLPQNEALTLKNSPASYWGF